MIDYHDLANNDQNIANDWTSELARLSKLYRYYSGQIFEEKLYLGNTKEDEIELFPVGLNLVRMLVNAVSDNMYGEWKDEIIKFVPVDGVDSQYANEAVEIMSKIFRSSNANNVFWELEVDRNLYGGCAVKVMPDLSKEGRIIIRRIQRELFYPIYDPEDPDKLLAVNLVVPISGEQAKLKYGISAKRDVIYRIEKWTESTYETTIDDVRVDAYSGVNPWSIVPFVYIPRVRTERWWGDSLVEDILDIQDEINYRIADMGEAINYNAHPTRYGYNLPRAFTRENYPLGPNVFWDLGKRLGNSPEPTIGILETKNPIPREVFEYVEFLYNFARTSVSAPPIAFGEDQGGGQRSGVTLEIRMLPLIKSIRRSRAYMTSGIYSMMTIIARILRQKKFADIHPEAIDLIANHKITPTYAEVLPRDRQSLVDEIVKRLSTNPPTISLETALERLGERVNEAAKIASMLAEFTGDEENVGQDQAENTAEQPKDNARIRRKS